MQEQFLSDIQYSTEDYKHLPLNLILLDDSVLYANVIRLAQATGTL